MEQKDYRNRFWTVQQRRITKLQSWVMNLQISQDKYPLFNALIYFGLRDNHLKGTSHRKSLCDLLRRVKHNNNPQTKGGAAWNYIPD